MHCLLPLSLRRTAATGALLGAALVAQAGPAIFEITDASESTSLTDATIGWEFIVLKPITITALGFSDLTPKTDLKAKHQVGIWDAARDKLVTSTTVLVDDPLTDGFRYHALASAVKLETGVYRIGAEVGPSNNDPFFSEAKFKSDPLVTLTGRAFSAKNSGFANPKDIDAKDGYFGPNMMLQAVPEPGFLGVSGLCALVVLRRRAGRQA